MTTPAGPRPSQTSLVHRETDDEQSFCTEPAAAAAVAMMEQGDRPVFTLNWNEHTDSFAAILVPDISGVLRSPEDQLL